jgi:Dolichyl-phosphate-mannose-protein mannosyltransferase
VDWLLGACVLAVVEATLLTIGVGAILRQYKPWALLIGVAAFAGVLSLVVGGRSNVWEAPRATYRAAVDAARQLAWWQRLIVIVASAAFAWRVFLAIVLPPFAYDALGYHLPIVASWIQRGRVGTNEYAACCSHYPSGAETLFAWPTVFLHDDVLADGPQILLALLAAVAVCALARWAGLDAPAAITAGALFALTPILLTQANTSYNDVAFVAFLLTATYFVARLLDGRNDHRAPSLGYAVVGGAATGLALGTKTSGIVVMLVLSCLVCARVGAALARDRITTRRAISITGVFVGTALLVGGWWYGRNWVETGNPVWPFRVSAAGLDLFGGPATFDDYLDIPPGGERNWLVEIARSWYHDLDFWSREPYWYEQRIGGLGPLWSWLGWSAVALFALDAVRRRRDVVVSLLLPLLLVFLLLPYKWSSRFTIFLPALGAIAVVALLARLRRGWPRSLLIFSVLVLMLAGVARASWQLEPAGRGTPLTAIEILGFASHPARDRTVGTLFFPEYAFLPAIPTTASVAVEVDTPSIRFVYPFFGRKLERTVTPLRPDDKRRLAMRLAVARPDYVVVGMNSGFDRRLLARPSKYERIFDEHKVRVYRVLRNE